LAATLGIATPPPRSGNGSIVDASPASTTAVAAGQQTPPAAQDGAGGAAALPAASTVAPDGEKASAGKSAPPLKPKGWCKSAGKKLAKLFVLGVETAAEAMHRKPNDPDDDDVDELGEGLGEQMAVWFPDMELTPMKKIIIAGSCIAGEMLIGSEKLPRKPAAIATESKPGPAAPPMPLRIVAAPAADTTPPEIRPPASPS